MPPDFELPQVTDCIGPIRRKESKSPSGDQSEAMRITLLVEIADQIWGGGKVAVEDANSLTRRGHQVTVISRSAPPDWVKLECQFVQVTNFRPENFPDADLLIGTHWSTVPWIASAGMSKGLPVHLCQGYEGDNPENEAVRDRIEATYQLPGLHHITISPHLTALLRDRFGIRAHEVRYVIDHDIHKPTHKRVAQTPLRVGLVGSYQVPRKDLATGYEACRIAHEAGQKLTLVRASTTPPAPKEQDVPFPVEWHQQLPPDQMGDYYRSLDIFLATNISAEEDFFLPAIEAMACGVPSILTNIPCFRNHEKLVGHNRYALFVDPKDPTAMAESLVLAGALPDVRTALRAGGIEVASHYHPECHGDQLEAALQKISSMRTEQLAGELRLLSKNAPTRNGATPGSTNSSPSATTPPNNPDHSSDYKYLQDYASTSADLASDIAALTSKVSQDYAHEDEDQIMRLLHELEDIAQQESKRGNDRNVARLLAAAQCLNENKEANVASSTTSRLTRGNAEQALSLYDERLDSGEDTEELHTGRGNALHALGRVQEAAQAFRAALAVGTRTPDNYNRLGVVLYQTGDLMAARQSFERALVLDPQHVDAQANLGAMPAA